MFDAPCQDIREKPLLTNCGTINKSYPNILENEAFLKLQIQVLRQMINCHYPNLGFLDGNFKSNNKE